MKTDKEFAHEVKLQQTARETVQYANFMDKIDKVRSEKPLSEQAVKPSSGIIRRLMPIVGLAAAALIALLIWQPWQNDLVGRYYQPYALNTTEMGDGEQSLQQAQNAYNSGEYTKALPMLEKYSDNPKVQLAIGNAQYKLGKFDDAIKTFKGIKYPFLVPTANWYLALTYLKKEQAEKAKIILQNIPEDSNHYKDAQKLLKKIK